MAEHSELRQLSDLPIFGLRSETSHGFLQAAFDCYTRGDLFAILRPGLDVSRLWVKPTPIELSEPPERGWGRLEYTLSYSDDPAQIVFTSGTEGTPKPIVLSHRNLADVVDRLNTVMELTGDVREYLGVPVSYSFGLGRARAVSAVGGAIFLPERFDPSQIAAMLRADEINAISAVPSLWRLILANPDILKGVGDRVRWIEIGSQYMSGAEKAAMAALFPQARIVQHYGLTEASRSTFQVISATPDDVLEGVGDVVDSPVEVSIGSEGEIRIRGAHVALGRAETNGSLVSLTDDDRWLVTKDRGEIRDGQLYYLGRLDDQINIGGIKLGAEALEDDIRRLVPQAAGGFAVSPLKDQLRGEIVLVGVEAQKTEMADLIEEAAVLALTRRGLPGKTVVKLAVVPELPRTATDKVQRRRLPEIINRETTPKDVTDKSGSRKPDLSTDEQRIAALWRKALPGADIMPEHSFYDAGGDSLSSVQVGLAMESDGAARSEVRATLEGQSLAVVARQTGAKTPGALPDQARRTWAVGMARGVMVLMVLLSHWGPGLFKRLGLNETIEPFLSILYRSGTPGFAAVFGIGIGAFMVDAFTRDPTVVLRRQRLSFLLVLTGLLLLAAAHITLNSLVGKAVTSQIIAFGLYGVLAYYAFALISGPLWMPWVASLRHPGRVLPLVALGLWMAWLALPAVLPAEPLNSILEFPRLMGLGVYSLPKLAGITCFGIAIGFWFGRCEDLGEAARRLVTLGGAGALFTLAVTVQSYGVEALGNRSHQAFVSLPATAMYICLVAAMTGAFLWALESWATLPSAAAEPMRWLIVTGGLALPVYVFHGLVIPVKDILVTLGAPETPSLLLCLGVFLISMALAGRRLYRMYF